MQPPHLLVRWAEETDKKFEQFCDSNWGKVTAFLVIAGLSVLSVILLLLFIITVVVGVGK